MKIIRLLRMVLWLTLAWSIQFAARAQSNLVNFYTWKMEYTQLTSNQFAPSINVVSSNNASIQIGRAIYQNSPFVSVFQPENPAFVGTLNTVPGATYQISCTLDNFDVQFASFPWLTFGKFETNYSLPIAESQSSSFTAVATSLSTTMSFNPDSMDNSGFVWGNLENVVVLPVSVPPYITQMTRNADGSDTLSLAGMPTNTYVLQTTTNVSIPATWTPLATNTLSTNYSWQFTGSADTNCVQRFYRLEQFTP